jgi:hypothetical protein
MTADTTPPRADAAAVAAVRYPKLPPRAFASLDAATYIAERFNDYISWADGKAVKAKSRYQWMRAITVVGGAVVPVLVNVDLPYTKLATTLIGIVVVLMVSLESVFHYREQWVNYRATEQFLRKEYFLFTAKEGAYRDKGAPDAFVLFVERVEASIEAENASTLQVLTTVSESPKERK